MIDHFPGNRLLVIDHEPLVGRLVKNEAEAAGFEVVLTEDPSTILETARVWRPSVLMLDLRIPGLDGIELLRGLAQDRCSAHMVLMSHADGKIMESAMQLGGERGLKMSGIVQKPVQLAALRTLLDRFKPEQKLSASDLAEAITADQLFLEYQLILDCRRGRMMGVEALVRWRHPILGILPPDQFIPLAEQTDLIDRLTDWVVVAAVKQMAAWRADNPALEIAVNISAKNLEDLHFPDRMHQHCQDGRIDPASMTLELTESGTVRETVQMMDVLTRLRLKGFKLSIDDYGTGYSSLLQLQQMPFSEVKIDRSFVMQMNDNEGCKTIVESLIDLARKLGLRSVAEGVEDEATLRSLIALGCDAAQGYHLSRPVTADRITTRICDYKLMRKPSTVLRLPTNSPFTNFQAWRRNSATVFRSPEHIDRSRSQRRHVSLVTSSG
jgi:EAL domain-containing protein (putative c-di-GMP-specific phosphodiesterase class I)